MTKKNVIPAITDLFINYGRHNRMKSITIKLFQQLICKKILGEARGGHLPKAINTTWTQLYNSDGILGIV